MQEPERKRDKSRSGDGQRGMARAETDTPQKLNNIGQPKIVEAKHTRKNSL